VFHILQEVGARKMSIQGMFTLHVCCEAVTIKGSMYRLSRMRCVGDATLWLRPMKNDWPSKVSMPFVGSF
jgi:hypothetical protein